MHTRTVQFGVMRRYWEPRDEERSSAFMLAMARCKPNGTRVHNRLANSTINLCVLCF